MPSKKSKGDEEAPKPLSHYVKDRLELTKQLFSCLKSKQIKSRLPANLQNKSMERIQQICLDEILGISSKRLLSIINNTKCPLDTESDSDIEHISLSEISSEDENDVAVVASKPAENAAGPSKSKSREPTEKGPNEPKTMLELIELEARARAIRSQLALEPVTKIELDDSDDELVPEESPVTGPVKQNAHPPRRKSSESSKKSTDLNKKAPEPAKKASTSKTSGENSNKTSNENNKASTSKATESSKDARKESNETSQKSTKQTKNVSEQPKKSSDVAKKTAEPPKSDTTKKSNDKLKSVIERPRKSISPPAQLTKRRVVINRSDRGELTITAPAPKPSAPPVKLKRNFSKTPSETNLSSTSDTVSTTSEIPKDIDITVKEEMITESRSSSPDVITMEQNISTYFISDSDDDEPPTKRKSPEKSPQKGNKNPDKKSPEKAENDTKSNQEVEKNIETSMEVTESSQTVAENSNDIKNSENDPKSSDESSKLNKSSQDESKSPENLNDEKTNEPEVSKEISQDAQNESGEIVDDDPQEQEPEKAPSIDDDDDNVVNLMSDTEIDLNPSDKEDNDVDTTKKQSISKPDKPRVETPKEVSHSNDSDDDIVEILHSEDDLDVDKEEKSAENPEEAVTWNQRYLRSSTVKNVLKTTKLASKVRGKLAATKKSQKESIQKKKNEEKEKQKEITEKISKLEEGSLEQFQVLKESSNSSV